MLFVCSLHSFFFFFCSLQLRNLFSRYFFFSSLRSPSLSLDFAGAGVELGHRCCSLSVALSLVLRSTLFSFLCRTFVCCFLKHAFSAFSVFFYAAVHLPPSNLIPACPSPWLVSLFLSLRRPQMPCSLSFPSSTETCCMCSPRNERRHAHAK